MEKVNEFNLEYRQGKNRGRISFSDARISTGAFIRFPCPESRSENINTHRLRRRFYFHYYGLGQDDCQRQRIFHPRQCRGLPAEPGEVHNIINDTGETLVREKRDQ